MTSIKRQKAKERGHNFDPSKLNFKFEVRKNRPNTEFSITLKTYRSLNGVATGIIEDALALSLGIAPSTSYTVMGPLGRGLGLRSTGM